MRKVIFESAISVDGFIEGPDGDMDWLVSDEENCNGSDFLDGFDTIFYGRKAYEKLGVTPFLGPDIPEAERDFYCSIRAMRKYVFSRTAKHVDGNAMVISENLEEEVKRIRGEDGKNIWFCGGPDILQTFAELDLVDEYILTVHPVLLKSGKPLFPGSKRPLNLKLIHKHKLKSGVAIVHYRPETRLNIRSYDCRSF